LICGRTFGAAGTTDADPPGLVWRELPRTFDCPTPLTPPVSPWRTPHRCLGHTTTPPGPCSSRLPGRGFMRVVSYHPSISGVLRPLRMHLRAVGRTPLPAALPAGYTNTTTPPTTASRPTAHTCGLTRWWTSHPANMVRVWTVLPSPPVTPVVTTTHGHHHAHAVMDDAFTRLLPTVPTRG